MVREIRLLVILVVNVFVTALPMIGEGVLLRVTVIAVDWLVVAVVAAENPFCVNRMTVAVVSAYVDLT